ncbi:uncharacterized protein [Antedon mediterranea]|uniref:uncharacterized protein n=1 Tax=Antedon mediterranea TaxID=105859 RepID=UPI003AF52B84
MVIGDVIPVCSPVESNNGPSLPKLSNQYSTSIEASILQKSYTQDVEEFYDEPGNRGSFRTVKSGEETFKIYDYDTDELYTVVGRSIGPGFYTEDDLPQCTIQRISSSPDLLPFGYEIIDGTPHIRHVNDILQVGTKFPEEYLGTEEIRGIPTNHWGACINDSESSSFYVDYYFTVPGYTTAYGSDEIPVRVTVNGTRENINASGTHHFENIYEFAFFRPSTNYNPYIFETPRGVYCEGRKEFNLTNPLPIIPGDIRMRIEIVSPNSRRIENTNAWFSETLKLVKYEHTAVLARTDLGYDVGDPVSEIHDYTTGVAYVKNARVGTCVVLPIANTSYEAVPTDPSHVRMRTAQELFFGLTDMNYEYKGKKLIRNILTDVWIGKGTETVQDQRFDSTLEWFFTAENWTENFVATDAVPIRMDIRSTPETGILEPLHFVLSIYEFRASIDDFAVFDVSSCFAENQKKILQFQVPGENIGYISHSPTLFLKSTQIAIAESSGVSFGRVANVMYDYSNVKVYVTFTLLDKAPIDGDLYNMTTNELSLVEAVNSLESSINKGDLIISMEVNDKKFEFIAVPFSLRSDVVFPPDFPFQGDTNVCDPQESRIEKPLPTLYESYQVYMEAKFVNEPAYMVEGVMYFDTLSLRSSIFAYSTSGMFQTISDLRESILMAAALQFHMSYHRIYKHFLNQTKTNNCLV